jgi:hypothetical protein
VSYCKCGHSRIDHTRAAKCIVVACGCRYFRVKDVAA